MIIYPRVSIKLVRSELIQYGRKKSEYTTDIATHYKSFRPPLHEILFTRSLKINDLNPLLILDVERETLLLP